MSNTMPDIVFVHGLWMHGRVFALHRHRLRHMGRVSHAWSYPSLRGALDEAADGLAARLDALAPRPLHLIGHSLGGLVVLTMLARHCPAAVQRVVLLGSPICGSGSARVILGLPLLRHALGRALPQWLARPMPNVDPAYPIGVIAGDRPIGLGRLVPGMEKPNDGMVSVAETRWVGARDHIVLPVTHMQMLWSAACLRQALHFLDHGCFDHPGLVPAARGKAGR